MRKKRILFCTEATFLNTGYATYSREILNYLHNTNKYEVAEYAAYAHENDPRFTAPWKQYGVIPDPRDEPRLASYKKSIKGQFGGFAFEDTCLSFLPDIVCDIRDFWMIDFIHESPYRKLFKWALMPTVDAFPQAREWIYTYSCADACFSYSDWSGKILQEQSNGKINYLGSAPPSAHPAYRPIGDQKALKESLGIPENTKIIGTVMRNQRRKLYPDLFCAFRKFLDKVDNPHEYKLYCHTSYPDAGWDIPELLNEHGLYSHTLFTYICPDSGKMFVSPFNGPVTVSRYTGKFNAKLANVKSGLSYEDLSKVMNLFDLYVQYANCEGFGLPQVEAAACAVPVMSVDYSAMSSVIRQLHGTPIPVKTLYKEMETGCERAVPNNDAAAELFLDFFNKPASMRKRIGFESRQKFLENFQWDKSGKMWEDYFDSVEILPIEQTWRSPLDIKEPEELSNHVLNQSYRGIVEWLFNHVLCDATKQASYEYSNMLSNLMYGFTTSPIIGSYFNESDSIVSMSKKIEQTEYTAEHAYQELRQKRRNINSWERKRAEVLGI